MPESKLYLFGIDRTILTKLIQLSSFQESYYNTIFWSAPMPAEYMISVLSILTLEFNFHMHCV